MILAALLLQAAAPQTALDAERAFAAAAQARGQWTAFREYAAADAVMFVPQPVNAQDWLKDRKDPPQSVEWWPTESWVSCDGAFAVNTGGWKRADGSTGYFTTVWHRGPDGHWKWLLDSGDTLAQPRSDTGSPTVHRARCDGKSKPFLSQMHPQPVKAYYNDESGDHSLAWTWSLEESGARTLQVRYWNGRDYERVLLDESAAPKP